MSHTRKPSRSLNLAPATRASGRIRLPGSKSISNRALLLAAMCSGATTLEGLLDSDDTRVMIAALRQLGVQVDEAGEGRVRVQGQYPFPIKEGTLFLGNAGTAFRPLTAALSLMGGRYELSGVPRMHERPIGDLVDALRTLGADIVYLGREGYPPLRIGALRAMEENKNGGAPSDRVRVRGTVSSQFLTALLMAAPLHVARTGRPLVIEVEGDLISRPYILITLRLMARFGVNVACDGDSRFVVPADAAYRAPGRIAVEGDASTASYFMALGALGGGPVVIDGVGQDSIQGDVAFADVVQAMGATVVRRAESIEVSGPVVARGERLRAFDRDFNLIPDAAMTAAAMAMYADGPCTLRNIGSWRVKETDRIHAMHTELEKLGARVESGPDWLRVHPVTADQWRAASIATYDDHRMAMCFSLAAFGPKGVTIEDPDCVGKTFPGYFPAFGDMLDGNAGARAAPPVITIDGPTASGKGTIAHRVAQALGWSVLDSGALYRLTALAVQQNGTNPDDEMAVARVAQELDVAFQGEQVLLEGRDVAALIRQEQVGNLASRVAAYGPVRQALLERQRAFRMAPGLVADGRDMGTVVFPDAPLKIFLVADVRARAERRSKQLKEKGFSANLADLLESMRARDERDRTRANAPLVAAADARTVDSSSLTIDETVRVVLDLWSSLGFQPQE
ncbi:bifunctional 3-phosphoshikimate 1-carboxyvinyltransferase/cytidylate kinase [Allopusillimonas soli]|uniref:Multifunctional fusion protein n=1 Tax=Allopusillimonas soli TaxID=659016 RepID=A0A853F9M4_9BURK|nr:bifunctional 3-phosphoshikimate 1-carboxyvinyltransferase/cytidylate kinase [Allopusillimonas soli]NYT35301.1 bifunctional 3-phosphoshikimate 1-carboxyvinyltransferase/cytidylate kinase [Allopusillimonas soli]TEA75724.1 bifunctional 3-phosphoshikimate 1-carboxyvinyltransferase/cytidylate kinase [Allopusillimonas soli]